MIKKKYHEHFTNFNYDRKPASQSFPPWAVLPRNPEERDLLADKFLGECGVTLDVVAYPEKLSPEKENWPDHFANKVTFRRGGKEFSCDFFSGYKQKAHSKETLEEKERRICKILYKGPSPADILECLGADCSFEEYDLAEFLSEFGYIEDGEKGIRRGMECFEGLQKNMRGMLSIFGGDELEKLARFDEYLEGLAEESEEGGEEVTNE